MPLTSERVPAATPCVARAPQGRYAPSIGLEAAGLGGIGYVYVPRGCEAAGAALQAEVSLPAPRSRAHGAARAATWTRSCTVHVAYHGCHQGYGVVNSTFALHAGYNEWAEPNGIVVLYPQVRASPDRASGPAILYLFLAVASPDIHITPLSPHARQARASRVPYNPKGCWDWWGYTGPAYASHVGPQLRAVRRMVGDIVPALAPRLARAQGLAD